MDENKKIVEVTVRMPESLKRDMQDLADVDDRSLSDAIRMALSFHVHMKRYRTSAPDLHAKSCQTTRGEE